MIQQSSPINPSNSLHFSCFTGETPLNVQHFLGALQTKLFPHPVFFDGSGPTSPFSTHFFYAAQDEDGEFSTDGHEAWCLRVVNVA